MTLVPATSRGVATSGLTLLFSSVLSGAAASIDSGAGGFATTYSVLEIFAQFRTTAAGATDDATLTFNNDGGANYDYQGSQVGNVTAAQTAQLAQTSLNLHCHGNGGEAGAATSVRVVIPNYGATTLLKSGLYEHTIPDSTAANTFWLARQFQWRSTAAINRIIIAGAAVNLVAGSSMFVYGR